MGFFRGDVKLLLEDVGALRPTLFLTVPRLLNRIYDRVSVILNSFLINILSLTEESFDFFVKGFYGVFIYTSKGELYHSLTWKCNGH